MSSGPSDSPSMSFPTGFDRGSCPPTARRRDSKVFISYSHRDRVWLERLQVHLAPLEREGKLDRWDDSRIRSSQRWREEVRKAIDSSSVIVLLLSADFLASEFIVTNELPPLLAAARDDGAYIMPVIVSPCRFSATPILSEFQAANANLQPLVAMRRHRQENLWVKLTNDIEDALLGRL
jgi:TIR domain